MFSCTPDQFLCRNRNRSGVMRISCESIPVKDLLCGTGYLFTLPSENPLGIKCSTFGSEAAQWSSGTKSPCQAFHAIWFPIDRNVQYSVIITSIYNSLTQFALAFFYDTINSSPLPQSSFDSVSPFSKFTEFLSYTM